MKRRSFIKKGALFVPTLLLARKSLAQVPVPFGFIGASTAGAGGGGGGGWPPTGDLVSEDAESGSTPSGWTDSGTPPTWGYSTAPAPLFGVGSLRVNGPGATVVESRKDFTANDNVWCAFNLYMVTTTALNYVWYLQTSGFADCLVLRLGASGGFLLYQGSTGSSETGSYSTGVLYYCWLRYAKGSGANGIGEFYIATTSTKPGSPTINITNGNGTTQPSKVRVGFADSSFATGDHIYDSIRVSSTSI